MRDSFLDLCALGTLVRTKQGHEPGHPSRMHHVDVAPIILGSAHIDVVYFLWIFSLYHIKRNLTI